MKRFSKMVAVCSIVCVAFTSFLASPAKSGPCYVVEAVDCNYFFAYWCQWDYCDTPWGACGMHDHINSGTFQNADGDRVDEGTTSYSESPIEVDCGACFYCHCLPYNYQDESGEWVEEWYCFGDTAGWDYFIPLVYPAGENCVPVEECE